nr:MAG TPA: hypothetical protein [Caudoviricetes sp.]
MLEQRKTARKRSRRLRKSRLLSLRDFLYRDKPSQNYGVYGRPQNARSISIFRHVPYGF